MVASEVLPKPTWMRLGFKCAPDASISGKDIGVVVLDRIGPHATLRHLGRRIRYIEVEDDLTVTTGNVAYEEPNDKYGNLGEHGLMSVLLLCHAPFELDGNQYVGLAPAANFIVLDHGSFRKGEEERLRRGIDWILERRDEWNVKIILEMGWNVPEPGGWIENTRQKPRVQGLAAAVEAGLLVVTANGNTRLENELSPIEHFAVGSYDDGAPLLARGCRPYADEPWGRNGDGHSRPDILAPGLYLAIPYFETAEPPRRLSYHGQTSGTSTLVAGVCAHILSLHPHLEPEALRQVLVDFGDPIEGYDNPAPRVSVARAMRAIAEGYVPELPVYPPPIRVTDPCASVESNDPIERGLALTMLAKQRKCSRADLWRHAVDESPTVRKVAIYALQRPCSSDERKLFWEHLNREEEGGVRGWWAHGLLQDSGKEELDLWIRWIDDVNWAVRWCVHGFLNKYPEFPALEKTFDPELISAKAAPVLEWYEEHKGERAPWHAPEPDATISRRMWVWFSWCVSRSGSGPCT